MNDGEPKGDRPPASNIAEFERSSALILAKLYEAFPVPSELAPSELDPEAPIEVRHIHSGTIEFLAVEGYLRHGEVNRHSYRGRTYGLIYYDAALSAKGLAALSAEKEAIMGEKKTRGKRLVDATRSGALDIAKAVIRELFTEGVKHILH